MMTSHHSVDRPPVSDEQRLQLAELMLRSRMLEQRIAALYRQGRIAGGVYLGYGHELSSAACAMQLEPSDVYAPLIRDMAGRLAKGETELDVLRVYLGRETGTMRGRDGNIHRGDLRLNILPMISHLGSMLAAVNGALLAKKLAGETGMVGMACVGEGGISTGAASEALNQAAIEHLPLVVIVSNNQYAYSTTNDKSFACEDLALRGPAFGLQSRSCNGNDADACLSTAQAAVAAARTGAGPQLIVVDVLRRCGHGEHDDGAYMSQELQENYPDCITASLAAWLESGLIDAEWETTQRSGIETHIQSIVEQVLAEPEPSPHTEEWTALSNPGQLYEVNL